jgi:hypothetical protein
MMRPCNNAPASELKGNENAILPLALQYQEDNKQFGVYMRPLRNSFSGDVRPAMLVLLLAAVFVLLVACANVTNLFLMRGAVRTKEMALCIAIGARGGRIIRQILTESFLVALLGGVAESRGSEQYHSTSSSIGVLYPR